MKNTDFLLVLFVGLPGSIQKHKIKAPGTHPQPPSPKVRGRET